MRIFTLGSDRLTLSVGLCLSLLVVGSVSGMADNVRPGQPAHDGTDTYTIDGLAVVGGKVVRQKVTVAVPILKSDTPKSKAEKIDAAVTAAGFASVVLGANGLSPTVEIFKATVLQKHDGSGEEIAISKPLLSAGESAVAIVDLEGMLSGVNSSGNYSVFHAAIGYDGLLDEANLTFKDLTTPTTAAVLTDFFEQLLPGLPISQRSLLSLDLADIEITFALPPGRTNYFVDTSTTDTTAFPSGGFVNVPEPSSFMLLGFGCALVAAACRGFVRRHVP